MELFQLQYAVMLADCRNFSRAAERLYITQPSLSQQIKKLEEECGFPLFDRSSKKVAVSAEGERFIAQARAVLAEFDVLQDTVRDTLRHRSDNVVFGISMASRSYFADVLAKLISGFPNFDFHLIEAWGEELVELVRQGRADIAIVDLERTADVSGLGVTPVMDEYLCAVVGAGHRFASRESIALTELAGENLILTSRLKSGIGQMVVRAFEQAGLSADYGPELSRETCVPFVARGLGITMTTDVRAGWYENYSLRVIPVEPHICRTHAIITANSRPVIGLIRAALKKELDAGAGKTL